MCSARMAFALRDLEGLTVESFEDSVPAPVVPLFRLILFVSLAGCGNRPWATRRGNGVLGYSKHRITFPFIERGLPAALRTTVPAYALPRRERRTGCFATRALPDRPLGAGFLDVFFAAVFLAAALFTGVVRACAIGRDCRCATTPCVGARWVTHEEQRPSRSALSSLATSSGPARSVSQYVVVVKLLIRGICHSAEAPVTRLNRRTH